MRVKRLLTSTVFVLGALGAFMPAAHAADPSVTVCASAKVTVNGQAVVDESHCVGV